MKAEKLKYYINAKIRENKCIFYIHIVTWLNNCFANYWGVLIEVMSSEWQEYIENIDGFKKWYSNVVLPGF